MATNNRHQRNRLIAAVLAAALLFAGCGGGDDDAAADQEAGSPASSEASAEDLSWVAQGKEGVTEVPVYAEAAEGEPIHRLANPKRADDAGNRAPLVFLVDGTDVDGDWIPVHLPVPPNGSTGFVRRADVDMYSHDYRIEVRLGAHELTLTKGGDQVLETTVGLGRAGRETPAGLYFITELLQSPDPDGAYGPYAYGISGFQDDPEVREEFGGEAVIGIHGTNEPDKLGSAVSSGCIRVENDIITQMAETLPLGVPVEVVA